MSCMWLCPTIIEIIDGKEAVSFLKTIKECLEEPRRLFLDL